MKEKGTEMKSVSQLQSKSRYAAFYVMERLVQQAHNKEIDQYSEKVKRERKKFCVNGQYYQTKEMTVYAERKRHTGKGTCQRL